MLTVQLITQYIVWKTQGLSGWHLESRYRET